MQDRSDLTVQLDSLEAGESLLTITAKRKSNEGKDEDEPRKKRKKRKKQLIKLKTSVAEFENIVEVQEDEIIMLSNKTTSLQASLALAVTSSSAKTVKIAQQEARINELSETVKDDQVKIKNVTANFWFHHEGAMMATQQMVLDHLRHVEKIEQLTAESKDDKALIQQLREQLRDVIDVVSPDSNPDSSDHSILSFASHQNSLWRVSPAAVKQESKAVATPDEKKADDRLSGFVLR
jgi:hypothetical protein